MKNKFIKRLSIIVCLLIIFNSISSNAANLINKDDTNESSLTNQNASVLSAATAQQRMGKYYSSYSEESYYDSTNELLRRANCYGYAFRMFYAPESFPGKYSFNDYYMQQVGEFAVKTSPIELHLVSSLYSHVSDYASLLEFNALCFDSNLNITLNTKMSNIVTLLNADASALGYTLTEYTGTTIPNATDQLNKRLIAVVVSDLGYHFYIQHGDNTWSHKPGNMLPTNKCLDGDTFLTNENIRSHALEGDYEGGVLKFFYITKDAVTDFKHMDGTSSARTRVYSTDNPGSSIYSAKDIGDWPGDYMVGCIDHPGDIDCYSLYTTYTENKTLYIESEDGYNIRVCVYDSSGELIGFQTTTSTASFTVSVELDTLYYLTVESLDFTSYEFDVGYFIS